MRGTSRLQTGSASATSPKSSRSMFEPHVMNAEEDASKHGRGGNHTDESETSGENRLSALPESGVTKRTYSGSEPKTAGLREIARGSAWMVAARWSMRGIGLLNTIILARLLDPIEFGIVAMAMVAVGFVSIFSDAGQDLAVIRHPDPTPEHFDTAWTMSVCSGVLVALFLAAIAPVVAWYYHEQQVVWVIRFIALAPLIEGFNNVGAVVGFRRDLAFGKDFLFTVVRKLSAVIIAIPLAFFLHNYWALAIGIVGGRIVTLGFSYWMHPYRPHLRASKLWEIWSYSIWMQVSEVGTFLGNQIDQILVGGISGAIQMGAYNIAADLAAAPTAELVVPVGRAIFPVYSTLLESPRRLVQSYLGVLSMTAIVSLSTAAGVALVADDLVALILGPKWSVAAPLVPCLAVGSGLVGITGSVNAVLSVTGDARLNAMRIWAFGSLLAPAALFGALGWGAEGVAAARMLVTFLFVPLMLYTVTRVISVTSAEIWGCLWRPLVSSVIMVAVVHFYSVDPSLNLSARLFTKVGLGVITFVLSLILLWWAAGCPDGAEKLLLKHGTRIAYLRTSVASSQIISIWHRVFGHRAR